MMPGAMLFTDGMTMASLAAILALAGKNADKMKNVQRILSAMKV